MANGSKRNGWATVIAVMTAVGLIVGLFFGLIGSIGLLPPGAIPVLVGLICGVAAPLLILRMRHTY